jgi:hypothetical protein
MSVWLVSAGIFGFFTVELNRSSGLNIGAFKEAAEHFLSAISLQENSSGDSSNQLWYTLRRALQSMVSRTIHCLSYST